MSADDAKFKLQLLVKRVTPLLDHLEKFTPSCHAVSVARSDFNLIRKNVEAAKSLGFYDDNSELRFRKFIVKAAP